MAAPSTRTSEARESWAGDSPLRGAARQRLIEAAGRCVVRDGLSATSISSVASEAGVSRPTVYRYFEDRHALILATVLNAGHVLGANLARHLRAFREPDRMAVEAMLYVLAEVPRSPLLASMWGSTVIDTAMLADFTRPDIIAIARVALDGLVKTAGWSDEDADETIEWMLRVLLSLLVAPAPDRNEAQLRRLLNRRLVPVLGRVSNEDGEKR